MRCDRSHAPEGDDRAGGPPFVLWTAMTVVAVLACSPRAFADDMPWLDLTVRAPPICPPGTEIEHEITRLVGDAPRDKGRLKATIDIAGIDDRSWRARVQTEYGGEGGERTRRFHELALDRRRVLFMPLHWVVVHPIDEASPLWGMTQDELMAIDAEFLVLLNGFDETFSQNVHTRSSYKAEEIVWGAKFRSTFNLPDDDGTISVDIRKLDDVDRLQLPR